jgi:hypothetical protein
MGWVCSSNSARGQPVCAVLAALLIFESLVIVPVLTGTKRQGRAPASRQGCTAITNGRRFLTLSACLDLLQVW